LTVSEGFGQCQCGGELRYKKYLEDANDVFNDANEEKRSGIKLPLIQK